MIRKVNWRKSPFIYVQYLDQDTQIKFKFPNQVQIFKCHQARKQIATIHRISCSEHGKWRLKKCVQKIAQCFSLVKINEYGFANISGAWDFLMSQSIQKSATTV